MTKITTHDALKLLGVQSSNRGSRAMMLKYGLRPVETIEISGRRVTLYDKDQVIQAAEKLKTQEVKAVASNPQEFIEMDRRWRESVQSKLDSIEERCKQLAHGLSILLDELGAKK